MALTDKSDLIVARMVDVVGGNVFEVAASSNSGPIWWRKVDAAWSLVHSGLNPTVRIYLDRCRDNFGYRIEEL